MDEQIKAAAVLMRPDAANLSPKGFLIPFRTGLGDNVSDVRWLVHVVLLRFGCSSALQPWPSPRTGVCKRKAVSQGPGTRRDLHVLQRNRVCRSGWKPLAAR